MFRGGRGMTRNYDKYQVIELLVDRLNVHPLLAEEIVERLLNAAVHEVQERLHSISALEAKGGRS